MNTLDKLILIKKIFLKNKRDWLQVILFALTLVFAIITITAYYSYQRFGKIMMTDGLNAHKLTIYGLHETDEESINQILNLTEVIALKKNYETYTRAHINESMVEFYSIPNNVSYFSKVNNLKEGEIIVSNKLKLKINNQTLTGKKVIGQNITITLNDNSTIEEKIIDVFDTSSYGIAKNSAFLSSNDMLKIADIEEKLLGEYNSFEGVYVAFVNDAKLINIAYDNINELGYKVSYMVSADSHVINTIYYNISLIFNISVFLFFGIKFFYLNNYFNKEQKQILNYFICGYSPKEIYKIYRSKNFICSILAIILSLILYFIGIFIYNIWQKELVAMGLKALTPWYLIILVYCLEIFLNYFITKLYFKKIENTKVSDLINYD